MVLNCKFQVATKVSGSTAVTSAATVMIASQPTLQQGQVVQLPIGKLFIWVLLF